MSATGATIGKNGSADLKNDHYRNESTYLLDNKELSKIDD